MYLDQIWVRLWNTAVRGVYFLIPFHNDCRPPWCCFFEVGSIEGDIRFVQSWFTEEWQGHHEENAAENSQQERVIRWSETWNCIRLYWLVNLFWNLKDDFIIFHPERTKKVWFHRWKMTWKATCTRFSSSPAKRGRSNGALHRTREKVHQGRDENGYPGISSERQTKNCWSFWCPTPVSLKTEVVIMATTWAELHVWLLMGCQNVTCEFMFWCLGTLLCRSTWALWTFGSVTRSRQYCSGTHVGRAQRGVPTSSYLSDTFKQRKHGVICVSQCN